MFQEVYEKLENKNKNNILGFIAKTQSSANLGGDALDGDNSTVIRCPIDFYPSHFLYEISDNKSMPPITRYYVIDEDNKECTLLEYSSECIYKVNAALGVYLTIDNVKEYIKFFFKFARGRHGRFVVLDSVDDMHWQEEPPLAARRAISTMITPIEILQIKDNNSFECSACFVFKDSLAKAKIKVHQNGQVEISDEEILVEDMPIIDDSFGS